MTTHFPIKSKFPQKFSEVNNSFNSYHIIVCETSQRTRERAKYIHESIITCSRSTLRSIWYSAREAVRDRMDFPDGVRARILLDTDPDRPVRILLASPSLKGCRMIPSVPSNIWELKDPWRYRLRLLGVRCPVLCSSSWFWSYQEILIDMRSST